ncbi:MAG: hypothetical protein ACXIUZ_02025 [Lysobacteraceae bacterium]
MEDRIQRMMEARAAERQRTETMRRLRLEMEATGQVQHQRAEREASTVPHVEERKERGVLGKTWDMVREGGAVVRSAATGAFNSAMNLPRDLAADAIRSAAKDPLDVSSGGNRMGIMGPGGQLLQALGHRALGEDGAHAAANLLEDSIGVNVDSDFEGPTSTAGQIARPILQFALAFGLTRRISGGPAADATRGQRMMTAAREGVVAEGVAFDGDNEVLSEVLLEWGAQHPALKELAEGWLSRSDNRGAMETRMRNALEGALLGVGLEKMVTPMLDAFRRVRGAREAREVPLEQVTPEQVTAARAADEVAEAPAAVRAADDAPTAQAADAPAPAELTGAERLMARIAQDEGLAARFMARMKADVPGDAERLFNFNSVDWEDFGEEIAANPWAFLDIADRIGAVLGRNLEAATGGVQSNDLTRQLAGMVEGNIDTVAQVFNRTRGGPGNGPQGLAAQMLAAHQMLLSSIDRVRILAAEVNGGNGTAATRAALAQQVEITGALSALMRGSEAEVGRTLQSLSIIRKARSQHLTTADGRSGNELLKELQAAGISISDDFASMLGNAKTAAQVTRMARMTPARRAWAIAQEVYINGLLSAVSTLTLNNVSNTLKVVWETGNRYLAVGIGLGRQGVVSLLDPKRQVQRVTLREANAVTVAQLYGIKTSLEAPLVETALRAARGDWAGAKQQLTTLENWGSAWRAMWSEQPQLDAMRRVDLTQTQAIRWGDGGVFGRKLDDDNFATDMGKRLVNAFGKLVRAPGQAVQVSDEVFKSMAYHGALAAHAARHADGVASAAFEAGTRQHSRAASKEFAAELQRVRQAPPDHVFDDAIEWARYQTWQEELPPGFLRDFEQTMSRLPLWKFVVPFYRTPVNILRQTIGEGTGLTLGKDLTMRHVFGREQGRYLQMLSAGGQQADLALGRLAMGWGSMAMVWNWYSEGAMTGARDHRQVEMDGIPPYSARIGGKWYQYNRLEPLGLLMGLAVDIRQGVDQHYGDEDDPSFMEGMLFGLMHSSIALKDNLAEKSWFQSLADLARAINDTTAEGAGTAAKRYGQDKVQSMTPFSSLLRRTRVGQDEYAREAFEFFERWQNRLPWASQNLALRRDFLGRPVNTPDYAIGSVLTPYIISDGSRADVVTAEFDRLDMDIRMPRRNLLGLEDSDGLTAEQYSRYLELRGQTSYQGKTMHEFLADMIEGEFYQDTLADDGRKVAISRIVSAYGQFAREQLLEEYPELMEAWVAQRYRQAESLYQ